MKTNLVSDRFSVIRFLSTTVLTGLVGGLLAAVMGFAMGGLLGDYLYRNVEPTLLLGLQLWIIFGTTHAVFYAVRRQTGSGSYLGIIAGGFGAGFILYLSWGFLPVGLRYIFLFLLPIAGGLSGYYLADRYSVLTTKTA
jgi:hypothetical protein